MGKRSSSYWKKRFLDLEAASNAYGQDAFRKIEPAFDSAQREIQRQIESWYGRYAKNNGISMQEARRQLSTKELKEFRWDVNEYIKYGQDNALNQQWMKELENASARVHISRLEALKIRIQHAAEVAFGNELDQIDMMARKVFTEDYYHSIFEMHKGFNIGWEIGQIDERKLNTLISKPWTTDNKTFKDRIWNSKSAMISELHNQMTRMCILGKAPDEAIREMTKFVDKKVKNAKYAAGRLVMTEQAFFHSAAQKEAFNELDVEEFEFVATLDSSTSDICQEMDGKHFPMKDYEPGVTAPPLHVWCRSVTVPYFEDNYTGERAARGADGKTYYVPDSLTYPEWKKSLVGGNGQGLQVIDNVDDLKVQLADKKDELNDLKKQIQDVKDKLKDFQSGGGNPYNWKFSNMSEDELLQHIDDLKVKEAKYDAEYQKYVADYTKYYSRPDRGTLERVEWDKWKQSLIDSGMDINDITRKMFDTESLRNTVTDEIKHANNFISWKSKYKGVTDQDFIDEIDKLTSKQGLVQDEIDDLNDRISDLLKKQAEAEYSAMTLEEIRKEVIQKHDSILKNDVHKKELEDIVNGMDKEHANLYNKMSEVFPQNHYYDKGTGWYTTWKKRVEMDLNSNHWDKTVGRNLTGGWKTKFHEEMHQLDHILGNKKSKFALVDGSADSYVVEFTQIRTPYGKRMITAIDDDIVELINTSVDWKNAANGTNIKHIKDLGRISTDAKRSLIEYLKAHYPTAKDRALIDTVTDAIGMTTSGKIHPYSQGFWGHKMAYCKSSGKNGATSEAWANIAGFMLRGDTEALEAVKKLMPKTIDTYQDIFDEVIEYAKTNDLKYK